MKKKITSLLIILFLIPFVNGLIGSIGNAKAIVTVDLEKTNLLERTVLIKNVNNVSVTIKLEPSGDIENITEILDKEFSLNPNGEKNARFKVTIPKSGTYNGLINIFFKPVEGKGAGVALQSNWIIKAVNGAATNSENPSVSNSNTDDNIPSNDNEITGSTVVNSNEDSVFSPGLIIFLVLVVIIVVSGFIILMRRVWRK